MTQPTASTPGLRVLKSPWGCSACRLRKVKCDEVRPVCGNCAKRYVGPAHCEYRRMPDRRIKAPVPATLSVQPNAISNEFATRSLELRLMHHYTRTVCLELPDCNGNPAGELWLTRTPMLAFGSEVILNTVLAISAIHLQSLTHGSQELTIASRALTSHRKLLAKNDKSAAETLLVSAIIISNITWLQAHRRTPGERYELPLHAYNMIQGVSALFLWKKSWFEDAGYGWFGEEEPVAIDIQLQSSNRFLLGVKQDLDRLLQGFHAEKSINYAVYQQATNYILWLYTAFVCKGSAGHLHRFVGTMPLRLDPGFLVLLKAHDPLCMALLARGIAILKLIDYAWWIHGQGIYEVLDFDITGISELMAADCQWAMEWPQKLLLGRIEI